MPHNDWLDQPGVREAWDALAKAIPQCDDTIVLQAAEHYATLLARIGRFNQSLENLIRGLRASCLRPSPPSRLTDPAPGPLSPPPPDPPEHFYQPCRSIACSKGHHHLCRNIVCDCDCHPHDGTRPYTSRQIEQRSK
jgi:hypothetical protein